jgi:[ribosomal protein S5]-alanine N-acetyltransferase
MQYRLVAVPPDQLRELAKSERPSTLAFAAEEDSLPPHFVASASLKLIERDGGPSWCTTYYIVRSQDNTIVGSGCFKHLPVEGCVEIGYGVAPTARRLGAATQAVKAFVALAFENGMALVLAEVEAENSVSVRVLESAGFALVGSREDPEDGLVGIWAASSEA